MSWTAALPVLLGTVVGASLALLADQAKWRRDRGERRRDIRRDCYAKYLGALHATSENLRRVSLGEHGSGTQRSLEIRAAFRSADLHGIREQVVLLAPQSVVRLADGIFRVLRRMRDLIDDGNGVESAEYLELLAEYRSGLAAIRNVMRTDLGIPRLDAELPD
nr:hypothetical protein [uncultured Actinoplanes sp.]